MSDIKSNELTANRILANCIGFFAILGVIMLFFLSIGFFQEYDNKYTSTAIIIATGLFLIPFILTCIIRLHGPWLKYLNLFICTIGSSIVTLFTSFDFILIMYVPTILSNMYFNKKVTYSTIILTTIAIILSYLFSGKVLKSFDKEYDYLPNLLIYLVVAFISYIISSNTDNLRKMSMKKAKTITDQNAALDKVIDNSLEIFGARSLDEFDELVKVTLKNSVRPFLINPGLAIRAYIGHLIGDKYIVYDPDGGSEKIVPQDEYVNLNLGHTTVPLKLKRQDNTSDYEVTDRYITICLYNNKALIHFVVISALINVSATLNEIFQIQANNIGIALRNLRLRLDMAESQAEMIYAFSKVTDSRSHHTGNHIKRVSEYMRVLALEAGYTPEYADKISIASMMHDIGKILIPTEIVEKKSGLSDEEYAIIKTHTTKGAELINNCPGDVMNLAKIMIREHHERWDGKGYLGMPGSKTHTVSRLIAVADVFDAMISKRPYKEPWPKEKVYDTIVAESGKQFDPRAVDVFRKCFDKLVEIAENYKDE